MYKGKTVLGVITARGGSKGVPRKNIRMLYDKPLIAWTILPALESKYIDYLIVSTEDEEIRDVSLKYGANVPFLRPIELAQDDTSSFDTIENVIDMLKERGHTFDYICSLQPTSPFRRPEQIDESIQILIDKSGEYDALISVSELERPIYWNRLIENNRTKKVVEYDQNKCFRRQHFEKMYRLNGMMYVLKTDVFLKEKTFEPENTFPYIIDKMSAIDIDCIEDFELANIYAKKNLINK